MNPADAYMMTSMLRAVVDHGTGRGVRDWGIRVPVGGKTGTTNDGTNVWFIGYTSDIVAGVWMGFDRPKQIKATAQGGALAAPAWTGFMNEVYKRRPLPNDWVMPSDMVVRTIDGTTNLLASAACPRQVATTEVFVPGTEPTQSCAMHIGGYLPDTAGVGASYPSSRPLQDTTPAAPRRGGGGAGGGGGRDSSIFTLPALPPRDTSAAKPRPPVDEGAGGGDALLRPET
jgi:penicillin-binding protein 1A